jgi:autotransporter-associated beta strand protein
MSAIGNTAMLRNLAGAGINGAGLTMNGAGTLVLIGTNTYTGGTTLASGQLSLNTATAIGPGTLTINGGTIGNTGGNGTVGAAFVANGTFTIANAAGVLNATTGTLADNTITDTGTQTKTVSGTFAMTDGTLKAITFQKGAQTGTGTATLAFNWAGGTVQNTDGANLSITGVSINLSTTAAQVFNVTGTNKATVDANSVVSCSTSGIAKAGPDTLVLAAANTFGGATGVTGGTLLVNGNQSAAAGAVGVGPGTLGGTGTVGGTVTVNPGGTVRGGTPTTPTGALTASAGVTLVGAATNGGALAADLGGQTTPSGTPTVSTLAVCGGVQNLSTSAGPIQIRPLNDGAGVLQAGVLFTITLATAPTVSTPFQLNGTTITTDGTNPTIIAAGNYTLSSSSFASFGNLSLAVDGVGNSLILSATMAPVPEPATVMGLAAVGLGIGQFLHHRCRRAT